MKRRSILLVLIAFAAMSPAFALDFGATVDNSTGYFQNSSTPFQQIDTLTLWLNSHLGENLTFNSQIHGTYETIEPPAVADLDTFNLVGIFPNVAGGPTLFSFTLGRFGLSDVTADIYSQVIDGFQMSFTYPALSLTTSLGYTGLILSPDSTIVMTKADSTAQDLALTSPNLLDHFGSPRIVGVLDFKVPSILLRQDFALQALFQQDLRPLFETLVAPGTTTPSSSLGGTLNTQYFTAALSGPLFASLFYNANFTVETGSTLSYLSSGATGSYQYKPILSYFASGGVRYYLTALLSSVIRLDAIYASGDADYVSLLEGNTTGTATAFQPITRTTVASVFSPVLKNIAIGEISYSVKPLSFLADKTINNLQTEVSVLPFFRPTLGPVGATGVDSASSEYYLGTEVDATVNFRPFSDLGLSVQGGLFLPNSTAFISSLAAPQLGGKLEVSFSF